MALKQITKKMKNLKATLKRYHVSAIIGLLGLSPSVGYTVPVTWTVAHGGSGQITITDDGRYTTDCKPHADYIYAKCPYSSGVFQRGTGGAAAYVYFKGDDGSTVTYRLSGLVSNPDTMTQVDRNSAYYRGLIVRRSETFVCSQFYDSTYSFSKSPFGKLCGKGLCLVGSNDYLGTISSSNYRVVSEVQPNYFINGYCK